MTSPYPRRPDPISYTGGWEVPVLVLAAGLAAVVLAALTGIGLACALFGGGWIWPDEASTAAHMLGALLGGHPGLGLSHPDSPRITGPVAIYVCVAACELVLIALGTWIGVLVSRYRRPRDQRGGMATRHDASQALGVHRLRSARKIIRPDLYDQGAAR